MPSTRLLPQLALALALLTACSAAPAPTPASAPAPTSAPAPASVLAPASASARIADNDGIGCPPSLPRIRLRPADPSAPDGDARFVLDPPLDMAGDPGAVVWRGDLNGDGGDDLLLDFRQCGNWGECVVGVFVHCHADVYGVALPPDYVYELRVGTTKHPAFAGTWRDLVEIERGGSACDDDVHEVKRAFDGRAYTRVDASRRLIQRVRCR